MPLPKLLYEKLTDAELFHLVKQEDSNAFTTLYTRHWAFLMDIAYKRFQSREKAEDIIQEIFISLYQKRHQVEFTVSLQAYLAQALKYKVLNEIRSMNIRNQYKKNLFFSPICKNDFAQDLEAKDLKSRVDQTIKSLPEKCKKVFYLSRWEKKSNRDISNSLSISVSTVEKHIGKALKLIREDIQKFEAYN